MFLILTSSGECSASALPRPIVDPPPTETCGVVPESAPSDNANARVARGTRTQQSTLSSFALESASCVTCIGVCIVAFE